MSQISASFNVATSNNEFVKGLQKLDGVPRTQTSRLLLSYYSTRSHGTAVCTTTCIGRNYCIPRDPASWQKNGRSIPDVCERSATIALPTAASPELLVDNHSSIAALDAFSTLY